MKGLLAKHTKFYTNRLMRQLNNYNRLLDEKIKKFRTRLAISKLKPRREFVVPETDSANFHTKVTELEEKFKRNKIEKAKLILKILAASVMSTTFLLIAHTMRRILLLSMKFYKRYENAMKRKLKRKLQKRKSTRITINVH